MPPKAPKIELTPEEKKALKLAKKEEKKRLKIEADKQLQRDYLGRELYYGRITIRRHERKWRQMLINLALPKMKEDLEFAWHNFERVIDCKNFTISLLMDEIKESEEQYMMNNKSHVDRMDKLIDLFQERIEDLQADYISEITSLQKRGEEEAREISLAAEEEENYLKTMLHILDVDKKRQKQDVRADYFAKLEEDEKKSRQVVKTLSGILETKFKCTMKETVTFLSRYSHQTKARRKEHDELKLQDDNLQELLICQLEKIRKTCEYMKVLKIKLSDSQNILERKLQDVQDETNFFEVAFSTLKKRLEINRKLDVQQIILLTVNYNNTIENLENLRDKAESILHICSICRKLETQMEKVRSYPMNKVEDTAANDTEEDVKEYMPSMELFWQRVAQVEASRSAINEEKQFLLTENELLKLKIYQYCQCINCPSPNRNIITKGIKHVTEGALEQQKYEKQDVIQFTSSVRHFDIDA